MSKKQKPVVVDAGKNHPTFDDIQRLIQDERQQGRLVFLLRHPKVMWHMMSDEDCYRPWDEMRKIVHLGKNPLS